jgi:hypothetical protein
MVVSGGHNYVNECRKLETGGNLALRMYYASGAGFGNYSWCGGYYRPIYVFYINMNEARVIAYKRVGYRDAEKVGEQAVVEGGRTRGLVRVVIDKAGQAFGAGHRRMAPTHKTGFSLVCVPMYISLY